MSRLPYRNRLLPIIHLAGCRTHQCPYWSRSTHGQ